jgi:glutamate synthase domain-containing protein 3
MVIDAKGIYYKDLNKKIRHVLSNGAKTIVLDNVNGQRYIADGIQKKVRIEIKGVPGNDLAAFANGPTIIVRSNAQDVVANTMNSGKIVVHGDAGDVLGYGMRGGKLFVRGDVGYRVGIHMKAYKNQVPVIIAGGTAGDFFGEYMAGGILILLGLDHGKDRPIVGNFCGTGMHGGEIYIRGKVEPYQLGKEVSIESLTAADEKKLAALLKEYCRDFKLDFEQVMSGDFIKLTPHTYRPYGDLYCYE